MIHFASRDAMNIDTLGDKKIEQLHEWGYLNSIEDIYFLNRYYDELIEKPGYQTKSVDKLLESIENSKNNHWVSSYMDLEFVRLVKKPQ